MQADTLAGADRAISLLKRASWSGWGRVPEYSPSAPLIPDMPPAPPLPPLHDAHTSAAVERTRRRARVYAHQQNAIDAPFQELQRARWDRQKGAGDSATARAASGRGVAGALGLVTNATSDTKGHGEAKRPVREKLRINRDAQRVKRMRTSVGHAARLLHFDAHCEAHAQRWNKKFITLTYRDADGWRAGHFSAYRKAMREWCARRGIRLRFVWVAELQKRGAVHYHVVVWLPKGKFLPHADAQGWWPHGDTNIRTAESPIGYITKYASKTTPNDAAGYPKGCRMHGHGGLDPEGRRHVRYWMAPMWVRDALTGRADIRKVSGGYMDKKTGEFLASPWRVCIGPGGEVWTYRIDQQESN